MAYKYESVPGKKGGTTSGISKGKAYDDKLYKETKGSLNFKSYADDRRRAYCNDWDEVSFLWIGGRWFQTGHGLGAHTYFENMLGAVNESYQVVGNLKEQVDAQLTSFKTLSSNLLQILADMSSQLTIRQYLENPTLTDAQTGDFTGVSPTMALWTTDTLNTMISILEDEQVPVPNFIPAILNLTTKLSFKLQDPYILRKNQIPGSFFIPYGSPHAYATLRDTYWRNASDGVDGNQGKAKLHMDKFGIKHTPFKRSMIEPSPAIAIGDPLGIAYFTQYPLKYAAGSASYTEIQQSTADLSTAAASFTNRRYVWRGDKPTCELYPIVNLLFGAYDATYNIYGGWTTPATPYDSQGYFNLARIARTGQAYAHVELETSPAIYEKSLFPLFGCMYTIHGTGRATISMQPHGTLLTDHVDHDLDIENHPIMTMFPDAWVSTAGKGVDYRVMKDFNMNWLAGKMFK